MIRAITVFLAAAFLMAGCGFTEQGTLIRGAALEKGKQAFDAGLENAAQFVCNIASVGSVKRKYLQSPEGARIYNDYCNLSLGSSVFEPVDRAPPEPAPTAGLNIPTTVIDSTGVVLE